MHSTRTAAVALALLLVAAPGLAQQQRVYQWKDAKGVTHYTDTPPAQSHTSRDINNKGSAPDLATVKPTKLDPRCTTARSNIAQLKSGRTDIGLDTDRDGKVDKPLAEAQRADQLRMAEASERNFCKPAT